MDILDVDIFSARLSRIQNSTVPKVFYFPFKTAQSCSNPTAQDLHDAMIGYKTLALWPWTTFTMLAGLRGLRGLEVSWALHKILAVHYKICYWLVDKINNEGFILRKTFSLRESCLLTYVR